MSKTWKPEQEIIDILENIAKKHFRIPSLETQNSDRSDFFDCGVVSLREALLAAFQSGRHYDQEQQKKYFHKKFLEEQAIEEEEIRDRKEFEAWKDAKNKE